MNSRHLSWKTHSENLLDMHRDGTIPDNRGERSSRAKLTEAQVLEILSSDETSTALGPKFGVSPTNISRIRRGRIWKHLSTTNKEK